MHNIYPYGRNSHISIQQTFLWYFLLFLLFVALEGDSICHVVVREIQLRRRQTLWQLRIIIERVAIVDWPTKCQRHDFIQNLFIIKIHLFFCYQQTKWMTECRREMVSQTSLVMRNYCLLALYEKLLLIIMQIFTYMWYPYRCYHQSGHSTVETRPRKTPFKLTHAFVIRHTHCQEIPPGDGVTTICMSHNPRLNLFRYHYFTLFYFEGDEWNEISKQTTRK